jgi:hypothetical protein
MVRSGLVSVMLASLLCACAQPENGTAEPAGRQDGADPMAVNGDEAGNADGPGAVCLQGEPFVSSGRVLVAGGSGEATGVIGLRHAKYEGCERFVADLGANGAAATEAGEVRVELLRDLGLVRITLAGVRDVRPEATDASFDASLARAAYVVWAPDDRSTFIDLHLADAAEAYATVLRDPARVVVDLRPGGEPLGQPAARGQRMVVLEPRPGSATYPLRVVGYGRTFEANVVVRLNQRGRQVRETFTTATAWVDAWGYFSLVIPSGPAGAVQVDVGEYSAKDGTWEGVRLDLDMR